MDIEDIAGKRVILHDHVGMEYDQMGLNDPRGNVLNVYANGQGCITVIFDDGRDFQIEALEDLEIIEEEDSVTDLTGKRVRINNHPDDELIGLEGTFIGGSVEGPDWAVISLATYGRLTIKNTWFDVIEEDSMEKSPQDSLKDLQKLCTTNNIHILISKNDYQIWDTDSDDTYQMNNVDDVMKAIECLNELKQWRQ